MKQKEAALAQAQINLDHTTIMQVETSVDEADIGRIHASTPVTFTVDAFPGETFTGAVSQLRKAPQVAQNVVTYAVVVAVANPAGQLLPGMTANVKFVTAQKTSVVKVPNTALRYRPPDVAGSAADIAPGSTQQGAAERRTGTAGSSAGRVCPRG